MDIRQVENCIRVLGEMSRAIAIQQNASARTLEDGLSCIKAQGVLIEYASDMALRQHASPLNVAQEAEDRTEPHSFKDYVLRGSRTAMEHFHSGNHHMECLEFADAVASFDAAIVQAPSVPEFHFNKGNALSRLLNFFEAIPCYDLAIALRPDYAAAYANRGNCLYERKSFLEAIESFDAAIMLDPGLSNAILGKGNAFARLGEYAKAMAVYDLALAGNPQLIEAAYNKSIVLELMLLDNPSRPE
jgi:tetratricopeptide (TPR) repeat protein